MSQSSGVSCYNVRIVFPSKMLSLLSVCVEALMIATSFFHSAGGASRTTRRFASTAEHRARRFRARYSMKTRFFSPFSLSPAPQFLLPFLVVRLGRRRTTRAGSACAPSAPHATDEPRTSDDYIRLPTTRPFLGSCWRPFNAFKVPPRCFAQFRVLPWLHHLGQ